MAHPQMYDDGDLHYQRVRALALALPEAREKVSHGRPAFFTQRVFAYYGSSVKGAPDDRGGLVAADGSPLPAGGIRSEDWTEYLQYPRALVVRAEGSDADVLAADPRAFRPAYLGASGWFALDLSGLDPSAAAPDEDAKAGNARTAGEDDWDEAAEWLEISYRLTAPARLRKSWGV